MNNETKRGRGRPKGGNSFTNITLEQLSGIFNAGQAIPVSRVWLEKMNVKVEETQPVVQAQAQAATGQAIEMKLED